MDLRELTEDNWEMLRVLLHRHQSQIWTGLPVIVQKWNYPTKGENTVQLMPAIMMEKLQDDGTHKAVPMPLLDDVPVHYPGGSGFTLTHPIKAGDEGLIVVSSRVIDGWWKQGPAKNNGPQPRPSAYGAYKNAMHNISDAMFVPGLRSKPTTLKAISTTTTQLRSDDGKSYFEMLEPGKGFNWVLPGGKMKLDEHGNLLVSGEVRRGWQTDDEVTLGKHTHKQPNDGHGDSEADTNAPTPGT